MGKGLIFGWIVLSLPVGNPTAGWTYQAPSGINRALIFGALRCLESAR